MAKSLPDLNRKDFIMGVISRHGSLRYHAQEDGITVKTGRRESHSPQENSKILQNFEDQWGLKD